ncbi:MAG TPA: PKD domain-containing protein [Flavisolibacter sp.]|nr:PKD domain-containing protein [Flavisolibacter sp.]
MKKLYFLFLLSFSGIFTYANHITGGEMYYTLASRDGNNYTYNIVLKLYRDCFSSGANLDDFAPIAIYNVASNTSAWQGTVARTEIVTLQIGSPDPCINNPPDVCYQVGYYAFTVTLPGTPSGYKVVYQRCCRISGINNLVGSSNVGATYSAVIPGTSPLADGPSNNSARFIGQDTVIVCADNSFCYNFGATDPDNDSLVYSFCTAYRGGASGDPAPNPPLPPNQWSEVPYAAPYSEVSPLGSGVTLDPQTGVMCGIAPPAGIYVVTVCVTEFRNGIAIATQRKDLQIKVGDCDLVKATLPASFPICDDFTRTFQNLAPANGLINSWNWSFGDNEFSSEESPTHTFPDTGTYTIKLVVNRGEPCADSATSTAFVYPGFFPDFDFAGVCANKPTNFSDRTTTVYGFVNSWRWDFGDNLTNEDTSRLQNPTYIYPSNGNRNVRMIVTSSKGCIDTVFKEVPIVDRPPISIIPKDTLICNGDDVQLQAVGNGTFSWRPNANISGGNTATPTVSPTTTTSYIVELNDNGCLNYDTARVRVVDFVTLQLRPDTVICATDSVRLTGVSDGLRFNWTPAGEIGNPDRLTTMALPTSNPTVYEVTATIGSCTATDNITITLVPYPKADAGPDTVICFNTSAQLRGSITGSAFTWTPVSTLTNANTLEPIAKPRLTTSYVLSVTDDIGCPKPKRDTVVVTVLPKVNAFAGRDTSVVAGQPLQFNAEGGTGYVWSPSTALNDFNRADPIAIYDGSFDSIRYKVVVTDEYGCADSTHVRVKIFRTNPQVFVPSAFTPNGDGLNDVFRPIAVGLSRLEYFRVFNRWGELVFSTTINEQGWDGRIKGKEQSSGTFVWVVRGVDFTGKVVFSKGTVTLIR